MNTVPAIFLLSTSAVIFLSSLLEATTWNSFPGYISCLADAVMATCAILALRAWRQQIDYSKSQQVAEDLIEKAHSVRLALHDARDPGMVTAYDLINNEGSNESLHQITYDLIPSYRFAQRHSEYYNLKVSAWRCEVYLSDNAHKAVARFLVKVLDFREAASKMVIADRRLRNAEISPAERNKIIAQKEELEDIIHGSPCEKFGVEIDNAFNEIIEAMRPFIPNK